MDRADEHERRQVIPFNVPVVLGTEAAAVADAIEARRLEGNGEYGKRCEKLLVERIGCRKAIMTPSGTAALEMCAILCGIEPGDQVIIPSYSFVTTATPFVARGAEIVWSDIRADTKNVDESHIEELVTDRTRAVVVVHYGGVACEMDAIVEVCRRRGCTLIEDAAQAIGCTYRGKPIGSFGHLAALSFHATKNVHCGEGGALLVNEASLVERAEVVRDKGTDRTRFLRGLVDKYTWVDTGSSYLMSELQAAFLWVQLSALETVNGHRLSLWQRYSDGLAGRLPRSMLPSIPAHCGHNGHVFPLLNEGIEARQQMSQLLTERGVSAPFHFVPLHRAPFWRGRYDDVDLPVTERVFEGLLRLPLYFDLSLEQVDHVCAAVREVAQILDLAAPGADDDASR